MCQPIPVGGLQKPSAFETPGSRAQGGCFPIWPSRLMGSQWVLVFFKIQAEGKWGGECTEAQGPA